MIALTSNQNNSCGVENPGADLDRGDHLTVASTCRFTFNDVSEFKQWLTQNDQRLRGRSPNEVAEMAITVGFSKDVVYGCVTDKFVFWKRLLAFWESPLAGKWLRLCEYQSGHDQMGDI